MVGKRHLTKTLSHYLGDDENALIKRKEQLWKVHMCPSEYESQM